MTTLPNNTKAEMLIRKPIQEVFEAFINPEVTTKFWFTKSSGKLEEGKNIIWTWEMYKLNVPVEVKQIVPHQSILIEWGEGDYKSMVEWTFKSIGPQNTFVTITNSDFQVTGNELVHRLIDSTGGFTLVIAGLKAWLEHGIQLNLIGDKFPKKLMDQSE